MQRQMFYQNRATAATAGKKGEGYYIRATYKEAREGGDEANRSRRCSRKERADEHANTDGEVEAQDRQETDTISVFNIIGFNERMRGRERGGRRRQSEESCHASRDEGR